MRRFSVALAAVASATISSAAFATLPPSRPDYLFNQAEREWKFAERLWRGDAACTLQLCEAGYRDGNLVLSVDRQGDHLRIVGGFKDCEKPSWNDVDLTDTPKNDRPAVARYLIKSLADYAAKQCGANKPDINVPDMALLFASTNEKKK